MAECIQKKDPAYRLPQRLGTDDKTAEVWLEAVTETLFDAIVVTTACIAKVLQVRNPLSHVGIFLS